MSEAILELTNNFVLYYFCKLVLSSAIPFVLDLVYVSYLFILDSNLAGKW